ncbi:MAG TPA: bifunctional 4-hydroxy-2-oxoglutarate aldolase/2-dehydro-3-deoxy-phosphogluconate aldolase [Propionibacteriaceae bacterium]
MTATMSRPPLSDRLTTSKVIAVLRASHVSVLGPVCDVLVEEGILSLELTLTTPGLLDALTELIDRYADNADVGVGTILNELEAQRAIESGARFLVTPTMNLPVVRLAVESQIAVFPGGLSPTELAAGWDAGATAVKIFPAQTVGAGYLKHLRGPFPDLEAIPSGGVDLDASREWLAAGAAAVSIGGPLLGDSLKGGNLSALRDRCRAVRAVIDQTEPT